MATKGRTLVLCPALTAHSHPHPTQRAATHPGCTCFCSHTQRLSTSRVRRCQLPGCSKYRRTWVICQPACAPTTKSMASSRAPWGAASPCARKVLASRCSTPSAMWLSFQVPCSRACVWGVRGGVASAVLCVCVCTCVLPHIGHAARQYASRQLHYAWGGSSPVHLDEVGRRGEPERVGGGFSALPGFQQVVGVRNAPAIHDLALLANKAAAHGGAWKPQNDHALRSSVPALR